MSKPVAVGAIGGAIAGALTISAPDVREWLHVAQEIAHGDSAFLVFCLLLLMMLGALLYRQRTSGDECAMRVHQLESVVQGMYALLATDDRYQDLPSYEEFAADNFSIAEIHRARSKPTAQSKGTPHEVRT